ncbi:MAG: hydrogenase maturation nickel metallochaperone HypA [Acidobacteria bacterium]|nr:hydrogenase maturation nickel metallochaperone HypA [Acidobacteriota bacterium]
MHESSLIPDLMEKIEAVARENAARKVLAVELSIGALAFIDPDHLREHFLIAAQGTIAEGAEMRISVSDDPLAADAHAIRLLSLEVDT